MLFSVLALLVVVGVVMKLSATQWQAVKPVVASGTPAATPGNATTRAVDLVNRAVEQGAAARAADAASQ